MDSFRLRGPVLAWMTVTSCGFCMLLFGYDQGVMSGLITSEAFDLQIFGTTSPSSSISGLVVAIYEIGAFVGALSTMAFGQVLGRKRTTIIGQVIVVLGAALQASSYSLGQMIAARIITGFGVGLLTATVPVWTSEIAPAASRGVAGGIITISAVVGLVISYWVDYGSSSYATAFAFRFPLSLQIAFCLIQLATIPFLPESPRWLLSKERDEDGRRVIEAIYDIDTVESSESAMAMFTNIKLAIAIENDEKSVWRDVFVGGQMQYSRRLLLAFSTQAMQQLSGINVIAYYATVVFEQSVGMSGHLALLMGGFTTLAFLCGVFIAIFIVDRVGRRGLMLWGFACACVGMAITAIGTSKTTSTYGAVATFGIFFFNFNFGLGLQIPPWLYGVEITPLKMRFIAGSVSAASGWIWNYAVVQVTQPGIASIGYKYFIVWAVLNFTWFWVVFFFYPETAKKTLEELDFLFMDSGDLPAVGMTISDGHGNPIEAFKREDKDMHVEII